MLSISSNVHTTLTLDESHWPKRRSIITSLPGRRAMSDNEKPPSDQPPSKSPRPTITTIITKPSLPSIQSLFGIRREDDLDTLLPPPELYPRSGEERDDPNSPRSAGPSYGAQQQPPASPPRPTRSLRPLTGPFTTDVQSPSLPRPSSSRRRTPESGSTDQPSRGQLLRRPSDASYQSPETPESAVSSRMDPRMAFRQMHSPSSGPRFHSPYSSSALQRADSSSSRSGRAVYPFDDAHGPPRTPRESMSSMSSTGSSFFGRPGLTHYQPGASSSSESVAAHGSDALRRRHTIGDDARTGAVRSPRQRSSRPSSPYNNSADRRRAVSPFTGGFYGVVSGVDSTIPSDRTLPPLPGLSSQSESQLPPRPYTTSSSTYAEQQRPTSRRRPTTSPAASLQPPYPPSAFPRRMSASSTSISGPSQPPPSYMGGASSYGMPGPSPYDDPSYGPLPLDPGRLPPQAYEQGRHRLYSASEVIRHFNVPYTEEVQPPSGSSGMGGERHKYECPYCQKGFNRPSSLRIHVNTHTGEKPFECSVPGCERRFSVMSNMRRHARTHDQARFMGDAVEVEDAEGEPESPPLESTKVEAASSPSPPQGPSSPITGPSQSNRPSSSHSQGNRGPSLTTNVTGAGRLRSPRTTRSRATRRSIPGQFQEPSMETVGLLRRASPTPSPPPQSPSRGAPVQRLMPVAPSLNLAATAHQLYEQSQQVHPPMVSPESGEVDPSTATLASPRVKRGPSPDSPDNTKAHKRSKSSPEFDLSLGGRRGGKGGKRGSRGSPSSKKS
ncbi:hypothetical protein FRB93_009109 [Tulasnella sp. JGI-2019a]|nr:hypothetical protein FRB93_009109 [Tulasnella sp. JGI-2019a]